MEVHPYKNRQIENMTKWAFLVCHSYAIALQCVMPVGYISTCVKSILFPINMGGVVVDTST